MDARKQTTTMRSLLNEKTLSNTLFLSKPHQQSSSLPLCHIGQRIKLIRYKLDERNIKAGFKLAALDGKIGPFSSDNYKKAV